MKSSSRLSPNPPLQDRCHHLSPAGRRCSQPACSSHPTLCFTHAPKPPSPEVAVAAELSEAAGSLETPEDVNRPLTKTVLAFIAGRLPAKKAGMIGFLGQIILRTHREIAFHQQAERKLHPRTIIHDLPRPDRSEVIPHPSEPLLPPCDEEKSAIANAAPVASTRAATQITANPQTQPINTPPPAASPMRPKKYPTSATSTQTTPRSTHASTPITLFPTSPSSVWTTLSGQANDRDLPSCTPSDAAHFRKGGTHHDSRAQFAIPSCDAGRASAQRRVTCFWGRTCRLG